MNKTRVDLYGGRDPRSLATYSPLEAAHYLGIPVTTLRAWTKGQGYRTRGGSRRSKPVIQLPESKGTALSFINLVEAHVLDSIRRQHHVSLQKVRIALDYLERQFATEHPLAEHAFVTDGIRLFLERYGSLVQLSPPGQMAIREVLGSYLRRIERDRHGSAIRLFPFTRRTDLEGQPRVVVIDPRISFGRPVLVGTGIATAVIAERYKAGESVADLAADYGRPGDEIEEAIRCELQAA